MKTFKEYKELAENGNIHAQAIMGSKYFFGDGCPMDRKKAKEMYLMAGMQGDRYAQFNYLTLYMADVKNKPLFFEKVDVESIFKALIEG